MKMTLPRQVCAISVSLAALGNTRYKKRIRQEIGTFEVEVDVRGGPVAVRGDIRLRIDPEWTAELGKDGALDASKPAPDLSRWVQRALTRCRVQRADEAPEAVLKQWLRMTEKDRAAFELKIPVYKLSTGLHWIVGVDEAKRIARTLGPDHPFGAFAGEGPFEVQGTDPFA